MTQRGGTSHVEGRSGPRVQGHGTRESEGPICGWQPPLLLEISVFLARARWLGGNRARGSRSEPATTAHNYRARGGGSFLGKGDEGGATENCRAPRSGGRRAPEAAANFFPTLPPGVIGCCSVTTGRPCSSQVVGPQLPTAKVQSWLWPVSTLVLATGNWGTRLT